MSLQDIEFLVLDPSKSLTDALRKSLEETLPEPILSKITIVNDRLADLKPPFSHFDCIVSPANSYGRLDGGFDYFLALALAPEPKRENWLKVTNITQEALYSRWKGYAPPGTCTIVPLAGTICENNQHHCSYIALVPTMRIPEIVRWNKEIVYNCVWSLLNSLTQHNASTTDPAQKITKVLMTGLGTGVGFISAETFAKQTAEAFKHFWDAETHPEKWSSLQWADIDAYSREVTPKGQLEDFEHTSFTLPSRHPLSRRIVASMLVTTFIAYYAYSTYVL
ncbi:hypothetical protein ONZ45_g9200 [Pleurotus djamor]|nr:hypothetical protein ONZ45_g9200 [Pleurotus djamor]